MASKKAAVLAFVCALGLVGSAGAGPVLDAGWDGDVVDESFADSIESPYVFSLLTDAFFRITDYFVPEDTWYVYDNGVLILTTTWDGAQASLLPIGDPLGDAGWTSGDFSHGEILLSAGDHSLTVQSDGIGGIPAGFYTRLDTAVPEPGTFVLLGGGMLALVALRRRRQS